MKDKVVLYIMGEEHIFSLTIFFDRHYVPPAAGKGVKIEENTEWAIRN